MSNEWGRDPDNEPDFTALIVTATILITSLLLATAMLQGCAPRQWPEIGDNVRVEKITIRECRVEEC